jgi:hypothetical protein
MKTLSANWFTEGLIDLEYKQYLLLAYLNDVKESFAQTRLYPPLSELIFHYRNLENYQQMKQSLANRFPQSLSHFDAHNWTAVYIPHEETSDTLREIDQIVEFSIPQIRYSVQSGQELYEDLNRNINIEPIGLLPLYKNEGYMLLHMGNESTTHIYRYDVNIFYDGDERLTGIHVDYVTTMEKSITLNYEQMKVELIRTRKELPNPATYLVNSSQVIPIQETLLPITKWRMLQLVASGMNGK